MIIQMHAPIGYKFNEYVKTIEVVLALGRTCRSLFSWMFVKLNNAYASTEDTAIT